VEVLRAQRLQLLADVSHELGRLLGRSCGDPQYLDRVDPTYHDDVARGGQVERAGEGCGHDVADRARCPTKTTVLLRLETVLVEIAGEGRLVWGHAGQGRPTTSAGDLTPWAFAHLVGVATPTR